MLQPVSGQESTNPGAGRSRKYPYQTRTVASRVPLAVAYQLQVEADEAGAPLSVLLLEVLRAARPDLPWGDGDGD